MKKIVLPLVLGLTLLSCKKDEAKKDAATTATEQKDLIGIVSVQKLSQTVFSQYIQLQGNVTTDQDIMVQPQMPGTLTLYVKQGDRVGAGQVIGRVADGGIGDQLKQAEIGVSAANFQLQQVKAAAELARITYEKQSRLWAQKIGSELQYLQARTAYQSSQNQISAAQSSVNAQKKAADFVRANLAKTAIKAPFSGVIDDVMVQSGQIVAPGTPIVKLINLGSMRVEANVPEVYLAKVTQGTPVEVSLPTINRTFNTTVRLVGNFINPQNRTFNIQIPITNEGGLVKPNLLATLKIHGYTNPSAIQVPNQYIYEDAMKKQYVFVATNVSGQSGVAKKVFIDAGEKSENSVEILRGLSSGDILITDGSKNLTDGQKIKIQ